LTGQFRPTGPYEEPEIAFELFQRGHGLGYTTEAGEAVVDAAAATGRARLWATVRVWNIASLRVLQKLSFVPTEHVMPDSRRGGLLWLTRDLSTRASTAQRFR